MRRPVSAAGASTFMRTIRRSRPCRASSTWRTRLSQRQARASSTSTSAASATRISSIPSSGMGLIDDITVTVIAPSGLEADGLDTAVSVLGRDRGLALIESRPGVAALIVQRTSAGTTVVDVVAISVMIAARQARTFDFTSRELNFNSLTIVQSASGPTAINAAASKNGGVYESGLVDQEAGDQRRQNPGDVADEVVDAGPQTDLPRGAQLWRITSRLPVARPTRHPPTISATATPGVLTRAAGISSSPVRNATVTTPFRARVSLHLVESADRRASRQSVRWRRTRSRAAPRRCRRAESSVRVP